MRCEIRGCRNTATRRVTFADGTHADVCPSCLERFRSTWGTKIRLISSLWTGV
jgi:hypothetical protein